MPPSDPIPFHIIQLCTYTEREDAWMKAAAAVQQPKKYNTKKVKNLRGQEISGFMWTPVYCLMAIGFYEYFKLEIFTRPTDTQQKIVQEVCKKMLKHTKMSNISRYEIFF